MENKCAFALKCNMWPECAESSTDFDLFQYVWLHLRASVFSILRHIRKKTSPAKVLQPRLRRIFIFSLTELNFIKMFIRLISSSVASLAQLPTRLWDCLISLILFISRFDSTTGCISLALSSPCVWVHCVACDCWRERKGKTKVRESADVRVGGKNYINGLLQGHPKVTTELSLLWASPLHLPQATSECSPTIIPLLPLWRQPL